MVPSYSVAGARYVVIAKSDAYAYEVTFYAAPDSAQEVNTFGATWVQLIAGFLEKGFTSVSRPAPAASCRRTPSSTSGTPPGIRTSADRIGGVGQPDVADSRTVAQLVERAIDEAERVPGRLHACNSSWTSSVTTTDGALSVAARQRWPLPSGRFGAAVRVGSRSSVRGNFFVSSGGLRGARSRASLVCRTGRWRSHGLDCFTCQNAKKTTTCPIRGWSGDSGCGGGRRDGARGSGVGGLDAARGG